MLLDLQQAAGWLELLLALLRQPLPPGGPTDDENAAGWPPWKMKKRATSGDRTHTISDTRISW